MSQDEIKTFVCQACFAPLDVKQAQSRIVTCLYCDVENLLPAVVPVMSPTASHPSRRAIHQALVKAFSSEDDLRELLFQLNSECPGYSLGYGDLSGSTVRSKIRELILWCDRRELSQKLVDVMIVLRPNIEFD